MYLGNIAHSNDDSDWQTASVRFERTISTGRGTTALESLSVVILVMGCATLGMLDATPIDCSKRYSFLRVRSFQAKTMPTAMPGGSHLLALQPSSDG